MSNLPFTSSAKDTPHDKCSNYSQGFTDTSMSVVTGTSSFTSNHQLIEQQIISENFRDMNVLSLPSLYCDPSKLGDVCKIISHNTYETEENLELQNVWNCDQEKSANHTNGSQTYIPSSAQVLSETQEAICDKNYLLKDKDKEDDHRSHGEIKRLTCGSCGRHFFKEKMLQRHKTECGFNLTSSTHQNNNQSIENSSASEDSDVDGEETIVTAADKARESSEIFACDECDKCFPIFQELIEHRETNHPDGEDPQGTDYRSSPKNINPSEKDFNMAARNENNAPSEKKTGRKNFSKAQRNFTCLTCGKSFRASKPLKEHEVVHTGARDFACEICGKAFGTRANVKIHLATHSDKKPFVCNICDATFRQKDSLKVHLRKHTGERPFPCTMCNMTFDRNFTLKNHLLTHAEEKSYVCVVCGKAFSTRGGLNNHERLHFKDPTKKKERKPPSKPGTGNWICDQCGKLYSTRSNLKMHQRLHRPTTVTHPCYVCGRVYKHKDSLEVHMRRHTDQRPYSCPTCGRTFYRNWTLKHHILTHTGEKPHKCLVEGCDKAFAQSSSLYNHVQNHHKQTDHLKVKSVEEISHTSESALQVNPTDNISDVNQSESIVVNSIQNADLPNGHLEVAPLFVVNTPALENPVNNLLIPTSIEDTLNPTLTRELAVKVGVEEIHSSVLDGLGITSATPEVALGQRQDITQSTPMNHVTHAIDPNSMGDSGVPPLVWENTVLPMSMNNITNMHLPQPHQSNPPPLQSMDQVYVLPETVPLLVSVDGHLYQQDNDKMAGLQNNFVSQLR